MECLSCYLFVRPEFSFSNFVGSDAQCQLDRLNDCWSIGDVRQVIDTLPRTLYDTYDQMLRATKVAISMARIKLEKHHCISLLFTPERLTTVELLVTRGTHLPVDIVNCAVRSSHHLSSFQDVGGWISTFLALLVQKYGASCRSVTLGGDNTIHSSSTSNNDSLAVRPCVPSLHFYWRMDVTFMQPLIHGEPRLCNSQLKMAIAPLSE